MAKPHSAGALNGLAETGDMEGRGDADFHAFPNSAAEAPKASAVPALDLLHWSEAPCPNPSRARFSATTDSSAFRNASDESPFVQPSVVRTTQPAGGVSTISFGTNFTLKDSDQPQRRRPGSDLKRREMRGSSIFEQETASESVPDLPEKPLVASGLATPQRASSQNARAQDLDLTPKRPTSLSEMAKQRELSGTFLGATETPSGRRPCSSAKSRELEGNDIFGRSNQDQPNTCPPKFLAADFIKAAGADHQENYGPVRTSVKVSNPAGGRSQISFGSDAGERQTGTMQSKKQEHKQKAAELSGHNVLKCGTTMADNNNNDSVVGPANEKGVSAAKRREMLGNDIFSDASPVSSQERPRRARQPPGGDSNLKLF